jgi:hypothetical protein
MTDDEFYDGLGQHIERFIRNGSGDPDTLVTTLTAHCAAALAYLVRLKRLLPDQVDSTLDRCLTMLRQEPWRCIRDADAQDKPEAGGGAPVL